MCYIYGFECTHLSFDTKTQKCFLKNGERSITDYLVRNDKDCAILEIKRWQQIIRNIKFYS